MSNIEQTLSIIKPDAVERNLDNEIKEMFKNKGFSIIKEKKIQIEKSEAEKFYKVHETKPFYNDLCTYLSSGPILVMVLEKENAVLGNRELMGAKIIIKWFRLMNFVKLFSLRFFNLNFFFFYY
jgi:nucleoside-diphosphate kinase